VGPRAVLNAVVKRKIPSPRRESNPRTPFVQPVTQRYTDLSIMALRELVDFDINILLYNSNKKASERPLTTPRQSYKFLMLPHTDIRISSAVL
jgi:hypothetical protein